jgi:dipeptidyl aminopeptidase/acylaminoacyl peptidase
MPPDVWSYDIATGTRTQLTFSTFAGIDKNLFSEPRLIRYKSFDGLDIPAFLYLPPDYDGSPIPFVIHAHGGPESQFRPSFIRHFQYLILNGYGVLAPNIRGSSGYGREFVRLDDYKKRKDSIRDIYEGARWLVAKGYAEEGRVGIKGGSYGGYVTLAALVDYPDMFGAGIDNIGIANFVTFLQNTAEYRRAIREAEYGPLTDVEFLTEISPLTHAERITSPLLIVHGENDPRVPVGEAKQIAKAVMINGTVTELLIFPDEGHGVAKLSNRLTYYRRMVEFLDRHLKK